MWYDDTGRAGCNIGPFRLGAGGDKENVGMKVLVVHYSETGNTAQIAQAIYDEAFALGHEVHLKELGGTTADVLNAYDLVFLGSACHDSDLAKSAKQLLAQIPSSPPFKLAGFATHATFLPKGGERKRELYETWASRCRLSFRQASQEKGITYLGYFGCMGAASAPIENFIHNTIITTPGEWAEYVEELRQHPNEDDLRKAREFAGQVLASC
jgi:flavodoxin